MKSDVAIKHEYTIAEKESLTKAIGACLAVQRTYGKQAGDTDLVVGIFIRVLNAYSSQDVIQAIKQWILESSEFPTPADIKRILDGKPKMSDAVYRRALKVSQDHEGKFSDSFDRKKALEYVKFYEKEISGGCFC